MIAAPLSLHPPNSETILTELSMNDTTQRIQRLHHWLDGHTHLGRCAIVPVSGDASFRRYFRVQADKQSFMLMDAPPEKEDCRAFVQITRMLESAGLNVPHIFEADLEGGVLLLGDLGDELYLSHLNPESARWLYDDALAALARIQTIDPHAIPRYERNLLTNEMELFREWLLSRHFNIELDASAHAVLDKAFDTLVSVALEQPQVFVHRDYHSRNLMLTPDNSPGILDYQDAVRGAVTYDLMSLLRDAYIAWPREQVLEWVLRYRDEIVDTGVLAPLGDADFIRWFDLMGVQRQLKVCGIFARLYHRDGKAGYLKDIPLTFGYLMDGSARYPETWELHELLTALQIEQHPAYRALGQ